VCGGCARGKGAVDWLVYYLGQRAYLPTCVYACFEGLGKGLSVRADFRPGRIAQMAHVASRLQPPDASSYLSFASMADFCRRGGGGFRGSMAVREARAPPALPLDSPLVQSITRDVLCMKTSYLQMHN
jgi:hypothetical protein